MDRKLGTNDLSASGLDRWLAEPLKHCTNELALRRCAIECAKLAVRQCDPIPAEMSHALDELEKLASNQLNEDEWRKIRALMQQRTLEVEQQEAALATRVADSLTQEISKVEAAAALHAYAALEAALHEDA